MAEKPLGQECLQRKTGHEPRASARAARAPLWREREREREQIAKSWIVLDIVLDGQGESGEISTWNRIHGVGRMDVDPGIDIKFAPKYLGGG